MRYLILILLLSSCSAKWHLQKAVEKDPTLLDSIAIIKLDTIYTDPVVIQDTFVTKSVDTITKETTKYRFKLIREYDTIKVDIECKPDTIVREVEVKCPPTAEVVQGVNPYWKWGLIGLVVLILLFAIKKIFS